MSKPEISYGKVNRNACCSCCGKLLKDIDAITFISTKSQRYKEFLCSECLIIMTKYKNNIMEMV